MRTLLLLTALLLPAAASASAEVQRLTGEMQRLATKGRWTAVERMYVEATTEVEGPVPVEVHMLGGQAAAQRGDATTAYRRLLLAERQQPGSTADELGLYRARYGRLHVLRVEATCITLVAQEPPFDPRQIAAVDFARQALSETGTFRGLLPVGTYVVGGATVQVSASTGPVVVQRIKGDSDCR